MHGKAGADVQRTSFDGSTILSHSISSPAKRGAILWGSMGRIRPFSRQFVTFQLVLFCHNRDNPTDMLSLGPFDFGSTTIPTSGVE